MMNKILRIKEVPPFGNFTRDFGHVTYFIPKGLTKKNCRAGGIMRTLQLFEKTDQCGGYIEP